MHTSPRTILLLAAVAAMAGCAQKTPPSSAATTDNVAVVDGKPISRNTYNHYVQGVAGKPATDLTPEQRNELLDTLIRGEAIASAAERDGLAARDETRAVLELSRLTVLQQAATQHYVRDRRPTEEELQAEYQTQIASMANVEYRARHILVPTEDQARALIARLSAGASFAQLARSESTDQGSRQNGGDLDWFAPDRMVKPFADAVVQLRKGQITQTPVQTSFGWHVIQLEDTRQVSAPTFESVKERLAQIVEAKKFKTYTDELMTKVKVEKSL